ncbi:hypothetical protein C0992_003967 [Termitomyces sp. T32_za158]|nr:hypothetical protein C0992_003967 [Termitomyces sp. T32_za158]
MSLRVPLLRLAGGRRRARVVAVRAASSAVVRAASNAATVSEAAHSLIARLKSLAGIHECYPKLVAALQHTPTSSSSAPPATLTREHLVQLLHVLASSARPADLQRVEEVLAHMPAVFGVPVSSDIHTAIVRGLLVHASDHTVYRWLHSMPARAVPLTPTLDQFHLFLAACEHRSHFKYVRHVIATMRDTGCRPTNASFMYFIRARWAFVSSDETVPRLAVFSSLFDDMKFEDLPYDRSVDEFLYNSYAERGMLKRAKKVREEYRTRFPDPHEEQSAEWKKQVTDIARAEGVEKAIDHYLHVLAPKGCKPAPQLFRAILRHSTSLDDAHLVQKKFNLPPSVDQYSVLIVNSVRAGLTDNALAIYEAAKAAGVVPDAGMVHPIIKTFCRFPTDETLDKALAIYRDLAASAPPHSETKATFHERARGPDSTIYNTLLQGIADSQNLEKYFPIAKELLADMEEHNIAVDKKNASTVIVLSMRHASTLQEALEAYHDHRASLDEKGYAAVLDAFCKLSFDNGVPVPSLTDYFDIVKDMRRAGLEITVEVYTTLLRQLGYIPGAYRTRVTPAHLDELVTTTRRVHDFLTLDAAVSPDEHVWNQLMNTYQRLGCFGDAYRVWTTMYVSGRFDHVSVSIMFDACGYAGSWAIASKVFSQLARDGFSLNMHNWNSWVECLCRLRRLNDALKAVCGQMGKNGNTVPPNVETLRILIKFARRDRVEADVQGQLKQHLPELWKTLPEDLRTEQKAD